MLKNEFLIVQYEKKNIQSLKNFIKYIKNEFKNKNYIWLLYGNVGVGKTTFIKQYCNNVTITSPSFVGYKLYDNILHFDTYYTNQLSIDMIREYYEYNYNIFIEWPIYENILQQYDIISIYITNEHYFITNGLIHKISLYIFLMLYIKIQV